MIVDEEGTEKLNVEKAQLFHHLVAKLLYLSHKKAGYTGSGIFSVHYGTEARHG